MRGTGASRRARIALASAALVAAAGCGGPATGTDAPAGTGGALIVIENYAFVPQRITVPPGAAVLVLNRDPFAHGLTSEAVAGSHVLGTAGGVSFDTPPFTGSWTLSIPASAAPGTVIPYFCPLHPGASPDGEIVIAAP